MQTSLVNKSLRVARAATGRASCCSLLNNNSSGIVMMMMMNRLVQQGNHRDFSKLSQIVHSSLSSSEPEMKITQEQLKAALERKKLEQEQRIAHNKKQEKERRKERNREFFKWVGLFSALFFGIMVYHLAWLWAPEIEGALKDSLIYYFRDSKTLTQLFLSVFDESKKLTHRTHLENVMATLRTSIRVANSGTFIQEFGTLQTCKCLLELVSTNQLTETIGQIYQQKVNEEENDLSKLAFVTLNSFLKHLTHHPEIINNISYLVLNGKEENLEIKERALHGIHTIVIFKL
ncbi:predicted protein [Naegleria gruberi]|uniref:Predicted protein n=1 Tax=Naegleria gruberi TaxID=5762 RepID=D2V473_NAEGR|nr:uncharacterized protein NAEGRDRAFT_63620 [Naegleria gruberi]EFC48332.1 predicted protein [Naegleria gruberi]|eukprot:XP_002681076.1 predicted protein [Naegleria gruberi strain NEG-M]